RNVVRPGNGSRPESDRDRLLDTAETGGLAQDLERCHDGGKNLHAAAGDARLPSRRSISAVVRCVRRLHARRFHDRHCETGLLIAASARRLPTLYHLDKVTSPLARPPPVLFWR